MLAGRLIASHSGKKKVVAGTADLDLLRSMDFGGADIVHGTIFAGLLIACSTTEGGLLFISAFFDEKVAHISLLCKRLQSPDRLQDAYTILSRFISQKLFHLHAAWPACAQENLGIQWFARVDKVVYSTLANLLGVPSLSDQARVISGMSARLTGAALPLGLDRAAAAALAFYVGYMNNLPRDQLRMIGGSTYMEETASLRDGTDFPDISHVKIFAGNSLEDDIQREAACDEAADIVEEDSGCDEDGDDFNNDCDYEESHGGI